MMQKNKMSDNIEGLNPLNIGTMTTVINPSRNPFNKTKVKARKKGSTKGIIPCFNMKLFFLGPS